MSGKEMGAIGSGDLVVVHCANPKEKLWGLIASLDAVGLTLRGLDLGSVEDWMRQERSGSPPLIQPTTLFLPMHRVLRIDLEESSDAVESYGDRFAEACGRDVRKALGGGTTGHHE
jgi:hypothetical protein